MASKEDPVRNSAAVGAGSAPAVEKVEAAAPEGVKVGSAPSAFMGRPLPAGRRKLGEKAELVYGGLRPCRGPTADEEQLRGEADFVSGGSLRAYRARRMLEKEEMEKVAVAAGKRKAEEGSEAEVGGEGAAAADATEVPAIGESFVDEATGIKWVDMPESYLCWVLSQKRMSPSPYDPRECTIMSEEEIEREVAAVEKLKAWQEGVNERFFKFQAWVRKMYEANGRVLVPEDSIPDAFTSAE